MDHQTLQLFSRQLSHWAEEIIESGRYPFRRVETALPLLTEQGELCLPLALWINRDSFMAGGLFLLPIRHAEEEIKAGQAFAQALGLRYFVTWAPRSIVIWESDGTEVKVHRTLALPASDQRSPDYFRDLLRKVLEEIKLLAITGTIPPAELSPWYLANLFRMTIEGAVSPLVEAFRIARGEERLSRAILPLTLARQQAVLAILRLLALVMEDRLPSAIPPEGLDRALGFALETLPPTLARVLTPAGWEVPFPEESAVRLHHLFRRLGQLRLDLDRARTHQALEIFLTHEGARLGGYPPPAQPVPQGALLINADRIYPPAAGEIAPPSLLAFSALLRHLAGEPPILQAAEVFSWGEAPLPGPVLGTFAPSAPPPVGERRMLAAQLRLSWPNRRFPAHPSAPRWFWELLHLLGLAAEEAELDLCIPGLWLTAHWADPLFDLLREHFTLLCLERRGEELRLKLAKEQRAETMTVFTSPEGSRETLWEQLREGHRSLLPLTLDLPQPLFSLLDKKVLQLGGNEQWSRDQRGIVLFSRSTIGRQLWRVVSGGKPLPSPQELEPLRRNGLPLPAAEVLRQLQILPVNGDPSAAIIDRELELWLGPLPAEGRPVAEAAGRRRTVRVTDALAEEVSHVVFLDGLPRFPEHYLYDHYRPSLTEYRFIPPLNMGGEFFGQMTLVDGQGSTLTVEGEETARALLLATYSTASPVALPVERRLTAELLERYLADLHRLRQSLVREAHRRLADPRAADQLIERVWGAHPLPPWPLVEDENGFSFSRRGL